MKKILYLIAILSMFTFVSTGCNNSSTEINEEKDVKTIMAELNLEYMGGLYARSEVNDMMLALFKSNGNPIVVITEFGNQYYGEYTTEDAMLKDGTEYTKITVENTIYGYHFNEDGTGILIDQNNNKYESKKLDESMAKIMLANVLHK